ncbi:MAG: rRNA (adenine1518-N6/adenine1519-N6)-dimethyltransferase [Blastocatellia bacterium]|jgi:16S rRNA (adenine1518-N6/adenine1519-N6)-dimethyltransferase|nr:rRNA (adenine1518-N6/adenine1519-N6)-dimethyltransferase [Blastocatellia bacterium]
MLRAKKSLGQNFLVDESVSERIVRAVGPRADETLLEIGPGRGALTARLVEEAGRVVAVEYDRELVLELNARFGGRENFELVEGDALAEDLCALVAPAASARVVANLPYYISTAILQRLIEQRVCLSEMVLMLQSEVVERITAPPGTSERGFLSVLVEAYCEAERLFDVAPTAFRPVPKVWSTVARLSVRAAGETLIKDELLFWQLASAGFAQRRKTIFNNLRAASGKLREALDESGGTNAVLARAGIEPQRRAETLSIEEWASLTRAVK